MTSYFALGDTSVGLRPNCREANLHRADLSFAELEHTDLTHADLTDANLTCANLSETNLTKATVGGTLFVGNDLRGVNALETTKHVGPSHITIDTIYASAGQISPVFLRGAGVPETFISSIINSIVPIEFHSCFISYSTEDHEFADRLHADLQANGVRCWFARENLKIGDKFLDRINESILRQDKLLIVLSERSIASAWVRREVEAAFEREDRHKSIVLFPIRVDDAVMETGEAWASDIRRTRHIGDFSRWTDHQSYRKAFERLLRDLKAEAQKS